jgi:hypothetical protein
MRLLLIVTTLLTLGCAAALSVPSKECSRAPTVRVGEILVAGCTLR